MKMLDTCAPAANEARSRVVGANGDEINVTGRRDVVAARSLAADAAWSRASRAAYVSFVAHHERRRCLAAGWTQNGPGARARKWPRREDRPAMSGTRRDCPLGILDEKAPLNELDWLNGGAQFVPSDLLLPSTCMLPLEDPSGVTGLDVGAGPRCSVEQSPIVGVDTSKLYREAFLRLYATPLEVRSKPSLKVLQHRC